MNNEFQRPIISFKPTFIINDFIKFGDQITLENIVLSVNKSTDKCLPYFMIGLHFQETYVDLKLADL